MRDTPVIDYLDLWRGIDDAVWREAARAPHGSAPVAAVVAPVPPAAPEPRGNAMRDALARAATAATLRAKRARAARRPTEAMRMYYRTA